MRTRYSAMRNRATQRFLINRPEQSAEALKEQADAADERLTKAMVELPAIQSRHSSWWQVWRVESKDGAERRVLVAEEQGEHHAFSLAVTQSYRTVVTKWDGRRRVEWFDNHKPVKVVEE